AAPAPTASAQEGAAAREGALFVLRVAGGRNWEVSCVLERDRGRDSRPSARGRGASSSGSLVGKDVVAGACEVEAGSGRALMVTLDDQQGEFACPFDGASEELCQTSFAEGATATFEVALR
ncbi:MAG: hypothetical protein MI723_13545, partial [Caulobacterales bacterium]|nr:hypothetical protein [Caulobacterales bacterium]